MELLAVLGILTNTMFGLLLVWHRSAQATTAAVDLATTSGVDLLVVVVPFNTKQSLRRSTMWLSALLHVSANRPRHPIFAKYGSKL